MISEISVKIALQGGGAKLMPMLAVAEAIHILQEKGELRLSGLAGTSAGAIVAAILALRINPRHFAIKLSDNGENYISRITGKYDKYTVVKILKIARATFFSKSFSDIQELNRILLEVFSSVKPEFNASTPLSEANKALGVEDALKIVVSDLVRSKKIVIGSSSNPNDSLLDSIVHSCALPIFFRNRTSLDGSPLVDGGLFNNFPVEEINDDPRANLIGITFDQPSEIPNLDSGVSYLLHLLLSTIDQSVKQSTDAVGPGDLISIKTDVTTLDFRKALGARPGSASYENTKMLALTDLREYIRLKNSREKDRSVVDLIRDNQKIFSGHHLNVNKRQVCLGLSCTLYDLAKDGEPLYSKYSQYTMKSIFSAIDVPVYAETLGTYESVNTAPLTGFRIQVTDDCKKEIGFTQIPGMNTICVDGEFRDCIAALIYFDSPVLPEKDGGGLVEVSNTIFKLEGGSKLSETKSATVQIENVTDIPYEEGYIVLHVPCEFPEISAISTNELRFSSLTEEEIDSFYTAPAGFKSFGWKTKNLTKDVPFSLTIMASG